MSIIGWPAQLGIPVANVPDYGTEEVADSAIGMALALTRGIHLYNQRMRSTPDPWMYHVAAPLYRHRNRVFGIVGLGRIGTATARRALAMGMDVRFYDPFKQDGYDKAIGVRRVETLEELMRESFILSLHCPLNEESRRMINAETLGVAADGKLPGQHGPRRRGRHRRDSRGDGERSLGRRRDRRARRRTSFA